MRRRSTHGPRHAGRPESLHAEPVGHDPLVRVAPLHPDGSRPARGRAGAAPGHIQRSRSRGLRAGDDHLDGLQDRDHDSVAHHRHHDSHSRQGPRQHIASHGGRDCCTDQMSPIRAAVPVSKGFRHGAGRVNAMRVLKPLMPSSCAGNRGLNGVDIVADACSDVRDAGEAELIVPLRGGSAVGPDERLGRGPARARRYSIY